LPLSARKPGSIESRFKIEPPASSAASAEIQPQPKECDSTTLETKWNQNGKLSFVFNSMKANKSWPGNYLTRESSVSRFPTVPQTVVDSALGIGLEGRVKGGDYTDAILFTAFGG
jgi:hypothetical protein